MLVLSSVVPWQMFNERGKGECDKVSHGPPTIFDVRGWVIVDKPDNKDLCVG